ncbi:MAG: Bifunctional ligase/repressor BirA [Alphaproteobacteria bacterium MarineAlpha2_Bin1]|nr:MAG: Bifunctional ligase/repressor BirA [Alphaproteobacteria bacterium MarineAlpha2_Bin1]
MNKITGLSSFFSYQKYDLVESTNELMKDLALKSFPEGTLIHAINQSKGKGRSGKVWESQKGNLFFSVLLRPKVLNQEISQLSFVSSLAVRQALSNITNDTRNFTLKWPNDILYKNKKISGILLESSPCRNNNQVDWVVVGIGINIINIPDNLDYVTCLYEHGYFCELNDVLKEVGNELEQFYNIWLLNSFDKIKKIWLRYCYPKGRKISVTVKNEKIIGKFDGITVDGSLKIKLLDNTSRVISGGEVDII